VNLLQPFTVPYMQRALVEVLVLGALAGAVGVLVVLRRLAFVGDALTHTVFPGVVIAHLLGRSLLLGALAFGVLTAVLLTTLGGHRRVGDDAALAILLTSFFSLGVVLISRTRGFTADLTVFLFGRVLAVDRTDLVQTLTVAAVAAVVLAALHKELVLRAFDPEATAAMGYRTGTLDLALNLLIALVVVAAVEAVGTVLVIALIVVPAAAARLLAAWVLAAWVWAARMRGAQLRGGGQLLEQRRPLLAEQVGPGQAAVAADHDQPVDVPLDQVVGGAAPALALAERHRAGGAEHRPAAVQDAADVVPGHRADAVAAVDQALPALVDGEDVRATVDGGADHGPDGRVHARGVAATGQHGEPRARRRVVGQPPPPALRAITATTSS